MSAERLLAIARRLDELSTNDGESELQSLAEELGELADAWPQRQSRNDDHRWAEVIRDLVVREVIEDPELLRYIQRRSFSPVSALSYPLSQFGGVE